jgi:hypothetical protein
MADSFYSPWDTHAKMQLSKTWAKVVALMYCAQFGKAQSGFANSDRIPPVGLRRGRPTPSRSSRTCDRRPASMSLKNMTQVRRADGSVDCMIVRPACMAWGGAAAMAREHSAECLGCDAKRGHVSVRDQGRDLVGVESCELLQNLGCNGGEGDGLQAECSSGDVAGLQEGVHPGRQGAIRGLRGATVVVASSLGSRRNEFLRIWLGFFRLSGLKSC